MTPRVHEKSQKSADPFAFNFYDPAYMKTQKIQVLRFSSIFLTPRSWKVRKIGRSDFLQFLGPGIHENAQKSVTK